MPRYYYWFLLLLLLVGCANMRNNTGEAATISIADTKTYFNIEIKAQKNILALNY